MIKKIMLISIISLFLIQCAADNPEENYYPPVSFNELDIDPETLQKEANEDPYGMLNVYFSGQYVGKTFLSSKRAGETFDISLGADREVMVKREKIHDKARETYFGKFERDTVVRELKYKITVENLKNRPVTLKILDHIPVSRTDRIEVKDLKLTPTPTRKDIQDRKGVMLWEQKLKPGAKNQITIEFVATYPKEFPPPF